ncbi:hypothetical protein Smp_177350, partial [Schistosoma mansoni]|uniref:hypothetical protein n=1 Tax=Schistosoma mansoni TaxID=6183 RepID=UPI00022DC1F5
NHPVNERKHQCNCLCNDIVYNSNKKHFDYTFLLFFILFIIQNNKKTHFWERFDYLPYSTILSNQSNDNQPKKDKIVNSDQINLQQSNLPNTNQLLDPLKTELKNINTQSNKPNKTTKCFSFISQRLSDHQSYSYGNISKKFYEPDPKKYSYKRRKSLAIIHGLGFRGRKIRKSNSSKLNQVSIFSQ